MANRSHVPQFGNWDSQQNVPYTVVFEKARKGRPSMVNPNDPEDNRSVLSDNPDSPGGVPPYSRNRNDPSDPVRQGKIRSIHERMVSREDAGLRQFPDPSPNQDNLGRKSTREAMHQRPGDRDGRAYRADQSVDRSPLHRQGRGRESPAWEGDRSYDSSQGVRAKTRLRPANNSRNNENIGKAAAVPAFGVWNLDPSSPAGYTHVFNKVREEKHNPPRKDAEMPSPRPYTNNTNGNSIPVPVPVPKKGRCLPWF